MNSPPRMNKHIRFASTSSFTHFVDVFVQHGSTPPFMETTEPIIQDKSSSPSPQTENVLPMSSPIKTLTQSMDKWLNKVERDVVVMKRLMALGDDDDDDMVFDDTPTNSPDADATIDEQPIPDIDD
ncbi:unnamed protein product [Lactuca saligna]|uniref:Uncharacterized protein n=1 Tax=Lactuca saligna TaxID=75948 RepID=A0AA35ZCM4_LACSI|nr:unnamed protein product [Lactuca saligna]